MFETEKKLRIDLLLSGVNKFERSLFEILSDDVRQCKFCKTTCFLSAVICKCSKNIVCLRHKEHLCKCSPSSKTLQFRYTIDEILLILKELNSKVALYEIWLKKVRIVLNANALTNKEEKDKVSL